MGQGGGLQAVALSDHPGSALSAAGIYAVLKRFFGQAAKSAADAGLDPRRFERASTHWMRHTFVRQSLVDGVPIEVVSELAGHASIDTTSIYSTQELPRKIKAVQGMRRRVPAASQPSGSVSPRIAPRATANKRHGVRSAARESPARQHGRHPCRRSDRRSVWSRAGAR
ncbi:MAG TPA: hypothetical protein DCP03_04415 [Polaromonas sp.]|nr:hypothetical protein [Polaromonas sp.]